jgi:DNA-directed RNA polymerase subunit M/transcription elongation factor TFIIS
MLCASCNNLLEKVTDMGKLMYFCQSCGTEFAAQGRDTLISSEDNKSYSLSKDGKTIWHYPANPKCFRDCSKCKSKIVAWENDKDMNKIYGCACGYSWKEYVSAQ